MRPSTPRCRTLRSGTRMSAHTEETAATQGSAALDRELSDLLQLGDRIVSMAKARGGADLVAECLLRSGAELSARIRKGEPELVEEASTRSAGLRVIQDKRVAITS